MFDRNKDGFIDLNELKKVRLIGGDDVDQRCLKNFFAL